MHASPYGAEFAGALLTSAFMSVLVSTFTSTAAAQVVTEIQAMTVPHNIIDMDTVGPAGPTSLAAMNAAGAPFPANIVGIALTPSSTTPSTYGSNAQNGRALARDLATSGIVLVDPPGGAYGPFNTRIDLNPSSQIGISIGDWTGAITLEFYLGGVLLTTFTSSTYLQPGPKYFGMSGSLFDRVDVRAATISGTYVIPDLAIQVTAGLVPAFDATPTSGASPLVVQFTDQTFTSDPGGVLAWAWDFNGDSLIDSTLQDPSFTYSTCGRYDVTLTVTDAMHGQVSLTKPSFITVDPSQLAVASFTFTPQGGCAPLSVQFTDTSTGNPIAWAWDFNGDGIVDSTLRNPTHTFTLSNQSFEVELTVRNAACAGTSSTTRTVLTSRTLTTLFASNAGGSVGGIVFFDVSLSSAVAIRGFETDYDAAVGNPVGMQVYTIPGTFVGNEQNLAAWTPVALDDGTSTSAGVDARTQIRLQSTLHLTAGSFGVALVAIGSGHRFTIGTGTNQTYSDGTIALTTGAAQNVPFTGPPIAPRVWNGSIYYCLGCRGTVQTSGQGCMDSTRTVLSLSSSGCPERRSQFGITLNHHPAITAPVFLIMGLSDQIWLGITLPLNLGPYGATGCSVYTSHELIIGPFPNQGGGAGFQVVIPNDPSITGTPSFWQGYLFELNVNPLNLATSNYKRIVIG